MKSAGVILDKDGVVKRTWEFNNPDDGWEQAPIPIEDGDEVIRLDRDHPSTVQRLALEQYRTRADILEKFPPEARTHRKCSIPSDGKTRRVTPRLTVLKQITKNDPTQFEEIAESSELH